MTEFLLVVRKDLNLVLHTDPPECGGVARVGDPARLLPVSRRGVALLAKTQPIRRCLVCAPDFPAVKGRAST